STTVAALGSLTLPNRDGTGRPNLYDIDSDDDGIPDNIEGQCTVCYVLPSGLDSDGDGIDDSYDNISGFGGKGISIYNHDGDAYPDYLDFDSDGDGLADIYEGNDFNLNKKPDDNVTLTGIDTDGDGLDDRFDTDNTSAKGTSAYMGNGGSFNGATSPGSNTMVQKSYPGNLDRDWRFVDYVLNFNFISFKGVLIDNVVSLKWTVSRNENVKQYSIERSLDGVHFDNLQSVVATKAKSEVETYSYSDDVKSVTASKLFYRIKGLDNNGKIKYSSTISLSKERDSRLQVVPNPVHSSMQVFISSSEKTTVKIHIIDMKGRRVYEIRETLSPGNNTIGIPVSNNWSNGSYILEAILDEKILTAKFSVQR
ncbi:MAG: T9SS type A sorting domain-containing protein, partial [Flavisolibacter sp.]|nr:T9SS type A sorting domain-containing protein [Flavisolibacter sp.]